MLSTEPLDRLTPQGWLADLMQAQERNFTGILDQTAFPFTQGGWGTQPFLRVKNGVTEEFWVPYEQTAYYYDGMIRLGQGVLLFGVLLLFLPWGPGLAYAGLLLTGLGCAPVYPSIIHSTPEHFGPGISQSMIGVEMASAYVGTTLMPPLFGLIANHADVALLPGYLLAFLLLMILGHEIVVRRCVK